MNVISSKNVSYDDSQRVRRFRRNITYNSRSNVNRQERSTIDVDAGRNTTEENDKDTEKKTLEQRFLDLQREFNKVAKQLSPKKKNLPKKQVAKKNETSDMSDDEEEDIQSVTDVNDRRYYDCIPKRKKLVKIDKTKKKRKKKSSDDESYSSKQKEQPKKNVSDDSEDESEEEESTESEVEETTKTTHKRMALAYMQTSTQRKLTNSRARRKQLKLDKKNNTKEMEFLTTSK